MGGLTVEDPGVGFTLVISVYDQEFVSGIQLGFFKKATLSSDWGLWLHTYSMKSKDWCFTGFLPKTKCLVNRQCHYQYLVWIFSLFDGAILGIFLFDVPLKRPWISYIHVTIALELVTKFRHFETLLIAYLHIQSPPRVVIDQKAPTSARKQRSSAVLEIEEIAAEKHRLSSSYQSLSASGALDDLDHGVDGSFESDEVVDFNENADEGLEKTPSQEEGGYEAYDEIDAFDDDDGREKYEEEEVYEEEAYREEDEKAVYGEEVVYGQVYEEEEAYEGQDNYVEEKQYEEEIADSGEEIVEYEEEEVAQYEEIEGEYEAESDIM